VLLTLTLFAPLAGALLVALVPAARQESARLVALAASLATLALAVVLASRFRTGEAGFQLGQTAEWVPAFGVSYKVGVDGVSLPLVLLTAVLTPLAVAGSWRMAERPRSYLALLLVLETAMIGAFVSLDLFLFYIFWEAVLVPAYFLIGSFGGPRRVYAAIKFFIYTLGGGLLMLVGIIALFWLHQKATGTPSFDYQTLLDFDKAPTTQRWLFAAFFAAFAVKTPLWPLHTWLPDAYTEAPTTTTVLLAGVMSKMGVYGFLRFAVPLFPDAARWAQPFLLTLAVVGILYCALVATMQRDFKTLVAYSSVSHLGFIVLGIFALNVQGLQGGVFYMVAHGLVIGGLFFVTGLVGFVGEFLTLLGAFLAHRVYAILAVGGVILGAVYLLWAYQRMWHGPLEREENAGIPDLSGREWAILAPLVAAIIVLGLFPRPVLDRVEPSAQRVVEQTQAQSP
jgi:NADH-quinone oxidoreductase subunit M